MEALPERGIALGDRKNLAFSSTAVTYGRGRAVVIATGQHTEIGTISALLSTVTPAKTPLEAHLDRVGRCWRTRHLSSWRSWWRSVSCAACR